MMRSLPVAPSAVAPVAIKAVRDVRVDTVRLSYPLDQHRAKALGYSDARSVGGYPVRLAEHVTLNVLRDRAAVEASLPNVAWGNNVLCLSLDQAVVEARRLYGQFGDRLPWSVNRELPPFEELLLARIDLVVDFEGIDDSASLLDQVDRNSRKLGIPTDRHANLGKSLLLRRRRWSCGLYDKHLETRGIAPFGHVRCEVRLRAERLNSPWAERCGGRVSHMQDLTIDGMNSMMHNTFEAVGFDQPLVSVSDFDSVVAASGLKPMEKVKLSGFNRQPECLSLVAPSTAKLYRERASAVASQVVNARALDIRSGELVTAA